MKVPISWLGEYVDLQDIEAKELARTLVRAGFEVDDISELSDFLTRVVVGKIIDIQPHFNSDNLRICSVDSGNEYVNIVTAAKNVQVGDYVPAALVGATLANGVNIVTAELRGVHSYGMLCSCEELGLEPYLFGNPEDGILILQNIKGLELICGQDIRQALCLCDQILDVSIPANRPDCQSIFGLAREVGGILGKKIRTPQLKYSISDKPSSAFVDLDVQDFELCPRYMAAVVDNVKIVPSPYETALKLYKCGIRAINNIVDITNIVLLEMGQPMHAFDLRNIGGQKIVVRRAQDGESIVALDGKNYELAHDMLVIADTEKPVAIAGVMGGEFSGVYDDTTTIVFEAAKFARGSVRVTSKKLGLRSDSSARFEKGVDTDFVETALKRALSLTCSEKYGKVCKDYFDKNAQKLTQKEINCSFDDINNVLGISIKPQQIIKILKNLQFDCKQNEDKLKVVVPTFRTDVEDFADLAEEVIRIYGYDNITSTLLDNTGIACGGMPPHMVDLEQTKDILCASGAYEVLNYSFISPKSFDMLHIPHELAGAIAIKNPLREEYSVMRTRLIHNMLTVVKTNIGRGADNFMLFECGRVYLPKSLPLVELPNEVNTACLAYVGEGKDFFDIKSIVDKVCGKFGFAPTYTRAHLPFLHDGVSADIVVDGQNIGYVGKVHPLVLREYDIERSVVIFELNMDYLISNNCKVYKFKEVAKFPKIERDLALVVDEEMPVGELIAVIRQYGGAVLEEVSLFDIYKGKQIAEGKKSIAFNLVFRTAERTLTDNEVNTAMQQIVLQTQQKGAEIRK